MGFSSEPVFILDRAKIPCEPGIYLLYDENEVVYVGQSSCNVKNRILTEHRRNKRFTGMAWVACDLDSLDGLERLLIKIFQPRFNKIHNPRWFDFSRQEQDYQIRLKQWGVRDFKSSLEYQHLVRKAAERDIFAQEAISLKAEITSLKAQIDMRDVCNLEKDIENLALKDEIWNLQNLISQKEEGAVPVPYIGGIIFLDGKKVKLQCSYSAHMDIGGRPISNEEMKSRLLPFSMSRLYLIRKPSEPTPIKRPASKKWPNIMEHIRTLIRPLSFRSLFP